MQKNGTLTNSKKWNKKGAEWQSWRKYDTAIKSKKLSKNWIEMMQESTKNDKDTKSKKIARSDKIKKITNISKKN